MLYKKCPPARFWGHLPKNIQKRYTDFWPLRKCLEIYSKEVHRLLAVTPRKSLHLKIKFRWPPAAATDSSQRHYETARKLVLCSRAIRTSTFLLGALRAPILHWNIPHFHIFRFKGGYRGVNRRDPQIYSKELHRRFALAG